MQPVDRTGASATITSAAYGGQTSVVIPIVITMFPGTHYTPNHR